MHSAARSTTEGSGWLRSFSSPRRPSSFVISALFSSSTLRFFSAPAAARTKVSALPCRSFTNARVPPSSWILPRLVSSSARFSRQFAARSRVRVWLLSIMIFTMSSTPPVSRMVTWISSCTQRLAMAPSALEKMFGFGEDVRSKSFFTPPA